VWESAFDGEKKRVSVRVQGNHKRTPGIGLLVDSEIDLSTRNGNARVLMNSRYDDLVCFLPCKSLWSILGSK